MTGPAVLITRPAAEADALSAVLVESGWQPLRWPLLDIVPRRTAVACDGVQAVLLTSANAPRACPAASVSPLPPHCLCVGEATASAARDAGFRGVTAADGDAAALVAAVRGRCDPADGPLLFLRGEQVAGDLAGALRDAGFVVREAIVYAAEPTAAAPPAIAAALSAGQVAAALFFSPRSSAVFAGLAEPFRHGLAATRAVAISPRAAAPLTGLGFATVEIAEAPRLSAMLDALGTPARGDVRLGQPSP